MNIISTLLTATYISVGAISVDVAIDFAKDFNSLNKNAVHQMRYIGVDMGGQGSNIANVAQLKKLCVNSAVTLSAAGYKGAKCDFSNGHVGL